MDLAHELYRVSSVYVEELVSILVLMDLAHELKVLVACEFSGIGFNPCFNGSCSRMLRGM